MRNLLFLFGILLTWTLPAQEGRHVPVAPGCEKIELSNDQALKSCLQQYIQLHIAKNFEYPEKARILGVKAKIYVNFVVEEDASVSDIEVVQGAQLDYAGAGEDELEAAKLLDEEAVRVISTLEFVKPAMSDGEPVRIQYTVPVNAKIPPSKTIQLFKKKKK